MTPAGAGASKPGRLGEIDAESVAAALIFASHFGTGMVQLLLDVTLVDFGRGREPGTQRMAREFLGPITLAQISANTGGKCRLLDETCHLPVIQSVRSHVLALAADPAEERTFGDPGELDPRLDGNDRAGRVGGAVADLDLSPTGLPAQDDEQALVEDLDPAAAVFRLVATKVQSDDLRAAQPPAKPIAAREKAVLAAALSDHEF